MICSICKKKTDKPFKVCDYMNKKNPICSKECYNTYIEIWRKEESIPKKINKVPQEIEEYPDY